MVLTALACALAATALRADTLKFTTLAPAGSTWAELIQQWAGEVEKASQGDIEFKLYPGGVAGDEPDVVRKMRFGQFQGAAFTGHGIGQIYPPARVLELPFLFRNVDEIDRLRAELMPEIERGFADSDYELLGWIEVGWVHLFSKHPIRSLDELKTRRVWLWRGDPLAQAFFKAAGIAPIPLPLPEVYSSLSTSLIDTVYSTPLAALATQWFTRVDYVTDLPMANATGALVVTRDFFVRLPPEQRKLLKESGARIGREMIARTRAENDAAVAALKQAGLEFVSAPGLANTAELDALRERAERVLTESGYLPAALLERVHRWLARERAAAP